MIIPTFPTPDQIKETINKVNELMAIKAINMRKNFHVKEGLTDCIRILNDRLANPENPYFKGENDDEWHKSDVIYRNQLLRNAWRFNNHVEARLFQEIVFASRLVQNAN